MHNRNPSKAKVLNMKCPVNAGTFDPDHILTVKLTPQSQT